MQVTPANIDEYFEPRRIDRERYLRPDPEIEAEIAALYQGKPVPRGQSDALARPPKPCAATLATRESFYTSSSYGQTYWLLATRSHSAEVLRE